MWQLTHLLTIMHAFLCCVSLEVLWTSLGGLDLGTYWGASRALTDRSQLKVLMKWQGLVLSPLELVFLS